MPRIAAPQAQNLLKSSEAIGDGNWNNVNVSAATGQPDPFGGTGASQLTAIAGSGERACFQQQATTLPVPVVVTGSVYLKQGSARWALIGSRNGAQYAIASFDLLNGVVGLTNNCSSTISPIGGGWYRCAATWVAGGATGGNSDLLVSPRIDSSVGGDGFTSVGTESVLAFGAQMVQANWAGAYTKTTAAAVSTGAIRSLAAAARAQVATRQNVFVNSADLTNAANWPLADQAITRTGGQADPFGGSGAVLIADTVHAGTFRFLQNTAIPPCAQYTASIYAKAATKHWIAIGDSALGLVVWYDLQNGVVGSSAGVTATIAAVSGAAGWYKCTYSIRPVTIGQALCFFLAPSDAVISYTGDGTGVTFYGPGVVQANWSGPLCLTTSAGAINAGPIRSIPPIARVAA